MSYSEADFERMEHDEPFRRQYFLDVIKKNREIAQEHRAKITGENIWDDRNRLSQALIHENLSDTLEMHLEAFIQGST